MAETEKKPGEPIDAALRRFKRKVKDENIIQELRKREHYEKPSERKQRKRKAAKKRTRQQQRANDLF